MCRAVFNIGDGYFVVMAHELISDRQFITTFKLKYKISLRDALYNFQTTIYKNMQYEIQVKA